MDKEYSQKEEDTFRLELFRRIGVQDKVLDDIKVQTTKTNGRVTVIETITKDYDEYKKIVSGLSGWKMWITGAVAVIIFGGGYVWNLVLQNILNTSEKNNQVLIDKSVDVTAQKVISQLEEKYDLKINK